MEGKAIILFDGICNLCNNAVQFIIRHDKKGYFSFAPLQSGFAKDILKQPQNKGSLHTIVLLEGGKRYTKSTAALKICQHLSGGWMLMRIFLIIPRFLRDWVYDFIAHNRYRWFGKRKECMLPTPALKKRFLI